MDELAIALEMIEEAKRKIGKIHEAETETTPKFILKIVDTDLQNVRKQIKRYMGMKGKHEAESE